MHVSVKRAASIRGSTDPVEGENKNKKVILKEKQ